MEKLFKLQLYFFMLLMVLWNVFTPVLEGADEAGHFCHAEYIVYRQKLPNLNNPDGCFLVYQPLYYLVLTPIIRLFDFGEGSYRKVEANPKSNLLRDGEYSQFIHTKDELFFRWSSFGIMIHILRLISSAMAIAIFISVWKVSKYVFKKSLNRNLSMLLFFSPMFLHIFTTLTNVVLVTFLTSLFIASEITHAARFKPLKITFLQGVIVGLGLLTKISILGLGFAYAYLFLRRWVKFKETFFSKVKEALIFAAGALIVSGWYIARSVRLYGEPMEVNVAMPYAGKHHWTLLSELGFFNFWNSFADTIFRTFWSGYGALTVNFPPVLNLVLLLITLLTAYGVFKFRRKMNEQLRVCFFYFLSVFIALVIVNIRTSSMHAKDLFTGYVPLAFLFGFGLTNFADYIKKRSIANLPKVLMLATAGYFYARVEVVRLIKWIYESIGLSGFYQPEAIDLAQLLLSLALKIIILLVIYKILIYLFSKVTFSLKTVLNTTIVLAVFNVVVLAVSVYLYYFKFL